MTSRETDSLEISARVAGHEASHTGRSAPLADLENITAA